MKELSWWLGPQVNFSTFVLRLNEKNSWKYVKNSWKYKKNSWKYEKNSWKYVKNSWKYEKNSWKYVPAVYIKAETRRKEKSMKNIATNFHEHLEKFISFRKHGHLMDTK